MGDLRFCRGLCCHATSVCLFMYSVETNKHNLLIFSPSGSHTILVFSVPNVMVIFRRRPNVGVECRDGMKNCDFRPISRFTSEIMQDTAILAMADQQEVVYGLYQTAISSMTLNDPKPRFKVTPLFDATYLSQKQYDIHNGIIPGTYARLTQVCHFK